MTTRRRCVRGRNFPQFDGHALASRNCAVSVARAQVHFGLHGLVTPTAGEIRKRMGTSAWATPSDVKRAVESYDSEAKKRGYRPLRYKMAGTLANGLYTSGASRAGLVARIKRLEMVHIVVDYAVVNDRFPALSGSSGFRSRHAIWVGGGTKAKPGWRLRAGKLEVRLADSTWGRAGTPAAAPRWVPLSAVWAMADGAWSSRGGTGWVGGSVACAPPLAKPQPEPEPEPVVCLPESELADLHEQLAEAQEQLGQARALIEELQTRRLPRELVDRLLQVAAEIDAAVPASADTTPVEQGMEVPE